MNLPISKSAIIAFALLGSSLCLGETPSEALQAYKKSAKTKDFDATWARTAQFEGLPDLAVKSMKEEVQDFINFINKGWKFDVWDAKTEGDCAVIIIHDQGTGNKTILDLDPVYFIKQKGSWKIMPDFTDWDIAKEHAKSQVDNFKKLDAWYENREAELKKERRK